MNKPIYKFFKDFTNHGKKTKKVIPENKTPLDFS